MDIPVDGFTFHSSGKLPANADKSFQYLLVRILIGVGRLSKNSINAPQPIDYSVLPSGPQTARAKQAFGDYLTSYCVGGSTKRFIQVTSADNRSFYRDLLGEFANYFMQTHRGAHTAAFAFLYRILERLSYSTPLLYCSTQTDYMGTFNDLKSLFDAQSKGELGFFRKFINQGKFIDPLKLEITYTINFSSAWGHQQKYFEVATKQYPEFISQDIALSQVQIKFRHVGDLLTQLRNRFFHLRTGDSQNNIRIENIVDPDEFFSCLNPIFCSFLSIVTLQSIARTYQV